MFRIVSQSQQFHFILFYKLVRDCERNGDRVPVAQPAYATDTDTQHTNEREKKNCYSDAVIFPVVAALMNEIAYVRSDHHAADAFPLLRSSLLFFFFVHTSSRCLHFIRCDVHFHFHFSYVCCCGSRFFFRCPNRQVGKKQQCEYGKIEKCLVGIVATSNARREYLQLHDANEQLLCGVPFGIRLA